MMIFLTGGPLRVEAAAPIKPPPAKPAKPIQVTFTADRAKLDVQAIREGFLEGWRRG